MGTMGLVSDTVSTFFSFSTSTLVVEAALGTACDDELALPVEVETKLLLVFVSAFTLEVGGETCTLPPPVAAPDAAGTFFSSMEARILALALSSLLVMLPAPAELSFTGGTGGGVSAFDAETDDFFSASVTASTLSTLEVAFFDLTAVALDVFAFAEDDGFAVAFGFVFGLLPAVEAVVVMLLLLAGGKGGAMDVIFIDTVAVGGGRVDAMGGDGDTNPLRCNTPVMLIIPLFFTVSVLPLLLVVESPPCSSRRRIPVTLVASFKPSELSLVTLGLAVDFTFSFAVVEVIAVDFDSGASFTTSFATGFGFGVPFA
jgi:hypothetical protein